MGGVTGGFNAAVAAVDKVSKEEVVFDRTFAPDFE